MKHSLLGITLVLGLVLSLETPAQAEGGFGFSIGLRLRGDLNWWSHCGNNGYGSPQVWSVPGGYQPYPYDYPYAGGGAYPGGMGYAPIYGGYLNAPATSVQPATPAPSTGTAPNPAKPLPEGPAKKPE